MDSMASILHLTATSSSLQTEQDGRTAHSITSNAKLDNEQITKETMAEAQSSDDDDVHQCGRCKKVFHSLPEYVSHKTSKVCKTNTQRTDISSVLTPHHSSMIQVSASPIQRVSTTENILEAAAKNTIFNHLQTITHDQDKIVHVTGDKFGSTTLDEAMAAIGTSCANVNMTMSKPDDMEMIDVTGPSSNCTFSSDVSMGQTQVAPIPPVKQGRGRPRKSATTAKNIDVVTASTTDTVNASSEKMVMRERMRPRSVHSYSSWKDDDIVLLDQGPETEDQGDGNEPRPSKGKRGRPKKKNSGLKCLVCSLVFSSKENLNEHKKQHSKLFKCKVCNKYFFTEAKRDKHMGKESHHYECETCHRILVSKTSLQRHQAVHSERTHLCPTCNRGFKTQRDMKSHILCVHSNQRDHVCDVCGKGFPKVEKLSRHKLIHAPNRPVFPCPFKNHVGCEKVFFRKDKLTRHLYSHSKIKPFKCDMCDKAFARTDNLREHIRTHTGVFRYYCTLCGKGQTGPKKFVQHMQKQHHIANPEIPTAIEDSVPETLVQQHKAIVQAESTARAVKAAENAIRRETMKKTKQPFKDGNLTNSQGTHVITVSSSGIPNGLTALQSGVSNTISIPHLSISNMQPPDTGTPSSNTPQQGSMETSDEIVPITLQSTSDHSAVSVAAASAIPDSRVTVQLLSQGVQPAQNMTQTISTQQFTTLLNSDLATIGEAVVRNSNLVSALFKNFPNP